MDITPVRFSVALISLVAVTATLWLVHAPSPLPDETTAITIPSTLAPTALRQHAMTIDRDEPDFTDAAVISSAVSDADASGCVVHDRIIRMGDLKYPLLRITDVRQADAGTPGSVLVHRTITAADHLMIGLNPGEDRAEVDQLAAACGGRVQSIDLAARIAVIAPISGRADMLRDLEARLVQRAPERDALIHAVDTAANDPAFVNGSLWGLSRIAADQAWDFSTGSAQVLVAVIDTGIDLHHPDLAGNIWTNPGESGVDAQGHDRANNLSDDDGNGYADDVHGVDFVGGGEPLDDNDHGTHVAGIIGACGGNHEGVVGVCWKVRLASLRILDRHGLGFASDAVRAVRYAASIGARVANTAWTFRGTSQLLEQAMKDASVRRVLFIAAGGNSGENLATAPCFPASFRLDNLITVAASDRDDMLASFSAFGSPVDLCAPGVDVLSTIRGGYASRSGTSAASAHVAGACALLAAFSPTLTGEQIKSRLLATVDPSPTLDHLCATGGRLNAYRALAPVSVVVAQGPAPSASH